MAQIVSYSEQQSRAKKNLRILKSAWIRFISLDTSTKAIVLSLALFLMATPMIVANVQNLGGHAATSIDTPPAIYFGVNSLRAPDDMSLVYQFEKDSGKNVSIVSFSENWGDTSTFIYPSAMDNVRSHGAIPLLTWLAGGVQNAYVLNSIIQGSQDGYLTKFAQEAKAWNHPFFLRFAPDINDLGNNWQDNNSGKYIKAWQHVHDIFVQNGVTNVTWVWSVNTTCLQACVTNYASFYPGDSYVDWIGLDATVTTKNWQSFSAIFSKPYADLFSLAPTKPLLIANLAVLENTSNTTAKATWITDAYTTQLPNNFPQIKAVVWDNTNPQSKIESSQASLQAFAKAVSSMYYMNNVYNDIVQSPIPPVGQYTHPTSMPSIATQSSSVHFPTAK